MFSLQNSLNEPKRQSRNQNVDQEKFDRINFLFYFYLNKIKIEIFNTLSIFNIFNIFNIVNIFNIFKIFNIIKSFKTVNTVQIILHISSLISNHWL